MRHFEDWEFKCKCGECGGGIEKMNAQFLEMIDNARDVADISFILNSAYRCLKHNAEEKSTSDNHPLGYAADIKCIDSTSRYKIITAALKVGFTRIGVHPKFIHVDNNPNQVPKVVWFY